MRSMSCPICGPGEVFEIIYQEKLPSNQELVDFSARKIPDNYHFKMVRCGGCGLLYAKNIYEKEVIKNLYEKSDFEYNSELDNLKETYSNYLKQVDGNKEKFLEIGCGSGFLLEKALEMGYKNVVGVEPSHKAVSYASEEVKNKILIDIFNPNHFEAGKFDVIFFAMIIEHIDDVNNFLEGIYRILKTDGVVLGIAHNENSFLSKVLKEKCPIINDEHIYVFNKDSLKKIFEHNNFAVEKIGSVANIYSLEYWMKMMPLPKVIKNIFKKFSLALGFDRKKIKIKAGNIFIVAKKGSEIDNVNSKINVFKDLENIAKGLRRMILKVSFYAGAHHIGSCLSCVDILTVLYFYKMKINPQSPSDPNRDWFILSKGHAAQAQYVVLSKKGFFNENILDEFLKDGSKLGVHPDRGCVPGVEVSTGSLGNGFSIGAGVALSAKKDNKRNKVYVLLGDGECNEGIVWETAMFAAHQKLDNLVAIIDYNKLQGFGRTYEVLNLDSLPKKFESFGWKVIEIDGHNRREIVEALDNISFDSQKPTAIIAHTIKGKGVSFLENKLESHYLTLTQEQYNKAIDEL